MTFCVERLVIPLPPSTFKWMRVGGSSKLPTPHVIPRLAQVALLGALMFFSIAVFTFAKPEQEERVWRSLWHCAGWSQGWRNSKIRVEKSWYIARCHSERHYNDITMTWHFTIFTFQDDLEDWQREIDEVMTEEDAQNGSQRRVHHGSPARAARAVWPLVFRRFS